MGNYTARQQSKQLYMGQSPFRSYHFHADLHSMLQKTESYYNWLYSNYVQLVIPSLLPEEGGFNGRLDYYIRTEEHAYEFGDFVMSGELPLPLMAQNPRWKSSNTQLALDCLDQDLYVYVVVDEFNMPPSMHYQKNHRPHMLFIYGYDMEKQVVLGTEFYHHLYESFEIPFEALDKPLEFFSVHRPREPETVHHDFDLAELVEYLEDYLYSVNTARRLRTNKEFMVYDCGLAVYGMMQKYLDLKLEDPAIYDPRTFFTLWEHKKLMVARLGFLHEKGYLEQAQHAALANAFTLLVKNTNKLRNLDLKVRIGKNAGNVPRMKELLAEVKAQDAAAMLELCALLKRQL